MIRSIARMRVLLATLAAAAATCVPTASAALTHDFLNEVGAGSFEPEAEPSGVAVDEGSGDVYVYDQLSTATWPPRPADEIRKREAAARTRLPRRPERQAGKQLAASGNEVPLRPIVGRSQQ